MNTDDSETKSELSTSVTVTQTERLAYSIKEAAALMGVQYFSTYRLIRRNKIRACRVLRGLILVSRSELLRLLKSSKARGCSKPKPETVKRRPERKSERLVASILWRYSLLSEFRSAQVPSFSCLTFRVFRVIRG